MKKMYLNKINLIIQLCFTLFICPLLFIYKSNAVDTEFDFKLTNKIDPVSFYLNNTKNIEEIEKNLNIYRKISICEFSGTGKTQLLRNYVHQKESEYDVIWFFDANCDLNSELIKLAKAINLKENQIVVSEDTRTVIRDIKKYFSSKKRWIFIFDNLKIGYNLKLKPILKWENNGHIIFLSEDANFLPNIINIEKFSKSDSIELAQKFLHQDKQSFANFIAETFYNHPGIIIFATQIVNNFPGLNLREYTRLIKPKMNYIKLNLDLAKRFLSSNSQILLNKIALINNTFSTEFIKVIHDHSYKNIVDLQRLMIINQASTNINTLNEENATLNNIYEINEAVPYTIRKSNSKHLNRKNLNAIIDKIILKGNLLGKKENYIFCTSHTTLENLQVILRNAEKYDLDLYKIIFLKSCILEIFMDTQDYHSASNFKDWFIKKNIEQYFQKDFFKTSFKKFAVSEYLMLLGAHYYFSLCDIQKSYEYLQKSLKIKNTLNKTPKLELSKFLNLYYFVLISSRIKDFENSDKFFEQLEILFKNNKDLKKDAYLLHSVNAHRSFSKKNYSDTLKEIELSTKNLSTDMHIPQNDIINTTNLILKARTLSKLSRYKESLILLKDLEQIHQNKAEDHVTLGIIYLYMAESYFKIGDNNTARSRLKKGKDILINDDKRNINQYLDKSKSKDLDLSYAYRIEGDIFLSEKEYLKAKECFALSSKIIENALGKENNLYKIAKARSDKINTIITK